MRYPHGAQVRSAFWAVYNGDQSMVGRCPPDRDVTFMGNSNPRVPLNEGLLRVSQRAVDPAKSTGDQSYYPHRI
jgi:hypothetical protein